MITVNTNMSSIIAQNSLYKSTNKMNTALQRLSTGLRISRAKDDAAGSAISTKLEYKVSSYDIAKDNAQMGQSMLDTANSTLSKVNSMLQRMRDLSEQAANGTYGKEEREAMQAEVDALSAEIKRIKNTTEFNGKKLFETENEIETATQINTNANKPVTLSAISNNGIATYASNDNVIDMSAISDDDWDSTAGKVIKLNTADDLKKLANITKEGKETSGRTFALGADIDMTSVSSFSPIGERNSFKGIFDGQGFTISGLKVKNQLSALFSQTDGATINNVVLNNIDINGQGLVTGGLIAFAYNTNLNSCFVTGKITASGYSSTGGLIGKAQNCIIKDCSTDITIERTEAGGSDYRNIGGFIGDADKNCTIENCIAKGSITCSVNSKKSLSVGGFIGYNDANNIESCASTVNIIVTGSGETSEQYIGGFVGKSRSGSIKNCISAGKLDNSCIGTRRKTGSFCSYVISGENNKYQYNTTYDLSNSGTTSTSIKGFCYGDGKNATYVANIAPSEFPSPKKPTAKDKYSDDPTPTPTPSSKSTTDYCRFNLQVGINSTENSVIEIDTGFKLGDFTISLLDSEDGTIKGDENARKALDTIDALMARVTNKMTDIASTQNRIESVIEFQEIQRNALTSANSLIKDADIALESANYIKNQILQSVTSSILATANHNPQIALQLI